MNIKSSLRYQSVGGLLILQLTLGIFAATARAAEEPGVIDRSKAAVKDATTAVEGAAKEVKESVQDASRSVGKSFENLWRRADEKRLKNRTRDEIVAWALMGLLVGAVAGLLTSSKTANAGKLGRLLLGLAGAFLGGMVVHLGRIDFGLGPVLIRYEELLFSLGGAVLLVVLVRWLGSGKKKSSAGK